MDGNDWLGIGGVVAAAASAGGALLTWRATLRMNAIAAESLATARLATEIAGRSQAAAEVANRLSEHAVEAQRVSNRLTERALDAEEARDRAARAAAAARLARVLAERLGPLVAALVYVVDAVDPANVLNPTLWPLDAALQDLLEERDRSENRALGPELLAELSDLHATLRSARAEFLAARGRNGNTSADAESALRATAEAVQSYLVTIAATAGERTAVESMEQLMERAREERRNAQPDGA